MRPLRSTALLLLCLPAAAFAHVVSISTGELHVDGPTATFELRIPRYEVAQVAHPETALLAHIRLGDGHLVRSTCGAEESTYVCRGEYEFPRLHPDSLDVECTLYQVTVPNHVHLLTATQGVNTDQEVFDQRFTTAEVRFRPPSPGERLLRDAGRGAIRALESTSGILFLIALALAARGLPEAWLLGCVFLASEYAARLVGPRLPPAFSSGLLEAVLALTVAYLAIEILLLPEGRWRWLVVGVLGLCHGVTLAGFPAGYLAGALPLQAAVLAILSAGALTMPRSWQRPAAALVLAAGVAWFGMKVLR